MKEQLANIRAQALSALEQVNDRGQLVIPKAARERFGLTGGQRLIVLSEDNEGIALVPADIFEEKINAFVAGSAVRADE